jgi:HTH-type transcriptional regulator/antitoxin MqsA
MSIQSHLPCPVCDSGRLLPKIGDYLTTLPGGEKLNVPDISFAACDHCGEQTISLTESRKVEEFVAEHLELISPAELRAIREKLGVDQSEMSEALGLGAKTYHRWEKGNQIPSRSMGYYLRLLQKHPESFAWIRDRSWRRPDNVVNVNFRESFPSLNDHAASSFGGKFNAARALCSGLSH